ncbi:type II toxin-antitoxin system RelE/ParE family toxin [Microbaculum sp. A6E488]|uniref:Type II toxin-antitoxin system RelE/ParE family toxin n=2 Tax=Microbaculum marinisediminis TaxID=2931392 RepID=A0AAW5QW06_9HYPH|nr:type II toxin-antitoxin system RelE/ParE family toxin [Microbaculum sp. A6E488]
MSDEERRAVIDTLASEPQAGDLMQGTGGCRKVRVAGRGKGKSGGYRVISVYGGPDIPVFLLTVFGKGEKSNLTKAERNALAKLTETLFRTYRERTGKGR